MFNNYVYGPKDYRRLRNALLRVHKKMQNPANWKLGICAALDETMVRPLDPSEIERLMGQWPGYSGNKTYPVPGDPVWTFPWDAYNRATREEFWDRKNSEYARRRWDLLEFLIRKAGALSRMK